MIDPIARTMKFKPRKQFIRRRLLSPRPLLRVQSNTDPDSVEDVQGAFVLIRSSKLDASDVGHARQQAERLKDVLLERGAQKVMIERPSILRTEVAVTVPPIQGKDPMGAIEAYLAVRPPVNLDRDIVFAYAQRFSTV